ncbi:MAG: hypothetical protein BYD32DRAFT_426494 [Podila humilis]|nr:MAG: hypothetical protein BYD32DRAFT_426494 [Podila humilis]
MRISLKIILPFLSACLAFANFAKCALLTMRASSSLKAWKRSCPNLNSIHKQCGDWIRPHLPYGRLLKRTASGNQQGKSRRTPFT